jgi:putative ABC transport system permease protein
MKTTSKHKPPRWLRQILEGMLDARTQEACLGDLEEKFSNNLNTGMPRWKANLRYCMEGLGFLRMARLQRNNATQTTLNLVGHTLLFFTRLSRNDKSYYGVSVFGLTLSLSSFLLIAMFIREERSFDKFHRNGEHIYKVTTYLRLGDLEYNQVTTAFPLAPIAETELQGIRQAVRVYPQDLKFEMGDKKIEEHIMLADTGFFDVFTFPFIYGDQQHALNEPASIVVTRDMAIRYFGNENPVGKTLEFENQTLTVTGVIDNVPEQSHIKFDGIVPLQLQLNMWKSETGIEGRENKWFWIGSHTYLLAEETASKESISKQLDGVVAKYFPERYKGGRLELLPLHDIHLDVIKTQHLEPGGDKLSVQLFIIVAFVILLVSSINLINLSWFKISGRIREVGIRKFLGQHAGKIVAQLAAESMMLGVIAFVMAIIICQMALPHFNLLVEKNLQLWSVENLRIMVSTLAAILILCAVAAIRPAWKFSTQSSYVLLSNYRNPGSSRIRNLLIGLQVVFSFVLLSFSFIISHQINFFNAKDLGFDKDHVIIVELNEDLYQTFDAFRNELKKSPHIIDVGAGPPPGTGYNGWRFVPEGGSYEKPFMFPTAWTDEAFFTSLDIQFLSGHNFHTEPSTDTLWQFIINRQTAEELGWQDDPVNKTMEIFAPGTTKIMATGIVVGVVEDYHYESLRKPVRPVVLAYDTHSGDAIIRISGTSFGPVIASIEKTWKKFSGKPMNYEILSQRLKKLYANEEQLSNVMLFFTIIALYLTCYGMFAMSSLNFSSRLKEVTIRKVFGATRMTIFKHFYSQYAAFNVIAIIAGVPLAIYLANLWLQTFEYHITLTPGIFIRAAICILITGLLSVSYYLVKMAYGNPVKFLRRD